MSSPGHITFFEQKGRKRIRPIHCYTWHDGLLEEAINDLIRLPFVIFNEQREACIKYNDIKSDDSGLRKGYWVYRHFFESAMKHGIKNNISNTYENAYTYKPLTHEDIYNDWVSMIPLQSGPISFANWFCQMRFNRWNVVPNTSWCSFSGPIATVIATAERFNSYIIECTKSDSHDIVKRLELYISNLNKNILNENFEIHKNNSSININCHCRLTECDDIVRIIVPFDAIYCELFWQDVQLSNLIISENRVSENPCLERFLNRSKTLT